MSKISNTDPSLNAGVFASEPVTLLRDSRLKITILVDIFNICPILYSSLQEPYVML